ncbi:MAG TPA: pyridoxamine 5'-phosphate oxidase family protein [Patescibacteria group bacterium]|nr:pyridoxamine 5'-phosphate oxidase family protein [Patescibacteria group bacterium]
MDEVLRFLQENSIFYLATVEGNQPRVRPFGFVLAHQGKLYFCTTNQKKVYHQLQANPQFEISTASTKGEWLRLQGRAVFNSTREIKQLALEASPLLQKLYSIDDPTFELFYINDAEATFADMSGSSRTIKL